MDPPSFNLSFGPSRNDLLRSAQLKKDGLTGSSSSKPKRDNLMESTTNLTNEILDLSMSTSPKKQNKLDVLDLSQTPEMKKRKKVKRKRSCTPEMKIRKGSTKEKKKTQKTSSR